MNYVSKILRRNASSFVKVPWHIKFVNLSGNNTLSIFLGNIPVELPLSLSVATLQNDTFNITDETQYRNMSKRIEADVSMALQITYYKTAVWVISIFIAHSQDCQGLLSTPK